MIDMQGILSEYLPLQLVRFGDVYADKDGEPYAWLSEYDFIWEPKSNNSAHIPLFLGDELVCFGPESDENKVDNLSRRIGGQPLRMRKISICSSRYILLVANELADKLAFSDKLGITRSVAEVYDAAGNLHTNFTALSFHKVFFHQRFETRFKNIPKESRLLVRVELDASSSTFLIHQSLLENWQKCGIEEVNYDIKDEHLSLNKLMTLNYYWPHRTCSFANMDDFQQNINGMIDSY